MEYKPSMAIWLKCLCVLKSDLGQQVNIMSFTWAKCHEVYVAEPALTLTMKLNSANIDKWMW